MLKYYHRIFDQVGLTVNVKGKSETSFLNVFSEKTFLLHFPFVKFSVSAEDFGSLPPHGANRL